MPHDAFAAEPAVADSPLAITALHCHGQVLLVGTRPGTLLVFRETPVAVDGPSQSSQPPLVLVDTRRAFSPGKSAIEQLELIPDLDMIFSRSDGYVHIYDSRSYELKVRLKRTKGCTQFAVARGIELQIPRQQQQEQIDESPSARQQQQQRQSSRAPSVASTTSSVTSAGIVDLPSGAGGGSSRPQSPAITRAPSTATFAATPTPTRRGELSARTPRYAGSAVEEQQGVPAQVIKLAVVAKRRIVVYRWADGEYASCRELTLSERIKSVSWIDTMQLCVVTNRGEYLLVDVETERVSSLFGVSLSGGAQSLLQAVPTKNPIARLPNADEVLVANNNVSVFIGPTGAPTRQYGIHWISYPEQIGYNFPYLIGVLGSSHIVPVHNQVSADSAASSGASLTTSANVEIRHLATDHLVQRLDIPHVKLVANSPNGRGSVYVASEKSIWRLAPVSFTRQVEQLVERKQFQDALTLLEQVDSIPADEKTSKIRKIQYMLSSHLLRTGKYDDAFTLLQQLAVDPVRVLAQFFPDFLPQKMRKNIDSASSAKAVTPVNQFTLFTSASTPLNSSTESLTDEYSFLLLPEEKPPVFEKAQHERAVQSLIRFLTEKRTQYLRQRQQQKKAETNNHVPDSPTLEVKKLKATFVSSASEQSISLRDKFPQLLGGSRNQSITINTTTVSLDEIDELLAVVDTALIKAYLITNDALVGPLLRVGNRCNVEETESLLLSHKKWSELLDLYFGKALHIKALTLLTKHMKSSNHSLSGTQHIVKYLKKLGPEHLELVFEYATTPLQMDPDETLSIFTEEGLLGSIAWSREDGHEYRDRIVGYLERQSMALCARFLEYIIKNNDDKTPEFHNKLALWYLNRLRPDDSKEWRDDEFESRESMDTNRQTLIDFLEKSSSYRPERLLSFFPINTLHAERAILLSRLGRHDQALSIYIRKMKSVELAERYCDKWWKNKNRGSEDVDVYMILLQILLAPNAEGGTVLIDEAIHVLSNYGERFNPVYTCNYLPDVIALKTLYPFFSRSLTTLAQEAHRLSLMKNIVQTERLQIRQKHLDTYNDSITIRDNSACRVCGKRILATSAFVILPGPRGKREWIHYACRSLVFSSPIEQ